jgi:hypothetical protein
MRRLLSVCVAACVLIAPARADDVDDLAKDLRKEIADGARIVSTIDAFSSALAKALERDKDLASGKDEEVVTKVLEAAAPDAAGRSNLALRILAQQLSTLSDKQRDTLKKDAKDFGKLAKSTAERLAQFAPPDQPKKTSTINVVQAYFGDLTNAANVPVRQPALDGVTEGGSYCSALVSVRKACQGQSNCGTSQDWKIDSSLCGYDPAPFTGPRYKGLIVRYQCVDSGLTDGLMREPALASSEKGAPSCPVQPQPTKPASASCRHGAKYARPAPPDLSKYVKVMTVVARVDQAVQIYCDETPKDQSGSNAQAPAKKAEADAPAAQSGALVAAASDTAR